MSLSSIWASLARHIHCWWIAHKVNRLLIDIAWCHEWANELERRLDEGLPSDVAREAQAELIEIQQKRLALKEKLSEVWDQRVECMVAASSSDETHKGG